MSPRTVKSAARVLEVLEYFAERRQPAALGEIAAALRYPQSSASVLLRCLHSLGYLRLDPASRRYSPTQRVALLGSAVKPAEEVQRIVSALHDATGETIILAQQSGAHAQYIQVLEPRSPVGLHLKIGTLRPITRAAVGRALLAGRPDDEIARLVRRSNALDPAGPVPVAAVMRAVGEVRAQGWTMTDGTMTTGAGVVAGLLPEALGEPRLALGVGAPIERLRRNRRGIVAALFRSIGGKS
ncbi:MAG: IclR family transcriptional regulator [Betaproteobacteria bacterium]